MSDVPRTTLALWLSCLAGCYGTGYTRAPEMRIQEGGAPFGWPLFKAVRADFWILSGGGSCKDVVMRPLAFLSFPLDLVVDVVLLPVDALAGWSGCSKNMVPRVLDRESVER